LKEEVRMTNTTTEVPVLRFYNDFPYEWEALPEAAKSELGDFLGALQRDCCSPGFLDSCERHDDYYAYYLATGYCVVWKLQLSSAGVQRVFTRPEKICVLAVDPPYNGSAQIFNRA
jgi:hypothetical protein